jgi:hypothetical protein
VQCGGVELQPYLHRQSNDPRSCEPDLSNPTDSWLWPTDELAKFAYSVGCRLLMSGGREVHGGNSWESDARSSR